MQKVKFSVNKGNGLQQNPVNQDGNIVSVDSHESMTVNDNAGESRTSEYEISHNHNSSVAPIVSQNSTNTIVSNSSDDSDDSTDSNDSDGLDSFNEDIESNQSIESIESSEDDGIDEIEFPPLTDKPVQVPDAAARYGISRQALYKRLNYLNFKAEGMGGKSYLSREQMETLDRLAQWIHKHGAMTGFLGEGALVVSQGNSVQKASTSTKSTNTPIQSSVTTRTGKAARQRQLSDAEIVAKRAEIRTVKLLAAEDIAVNYLLQNPDKISDEVMDEVFAFRETIQSSMVDSAGKLDVETFAKDILNIYAQAG